MISRLLSHHGSKSVEGSDLWVVPRKKRYMYVRKNNLTLYFTHLPRSPRRRICTKIGIEGRLADIINCDNFFWQSVQGFGFCRGPKFAISHWLSRSQLTQCWRYRAARDVPILHHFWDVTRYWSKIAKLNLPHLYLASPLGRSRWNFAEILASENYGVPGLGLLYGVVCVILGLVIFVELRLVAHWRTDGPTMTDDSIYRDSIASRGKKLQIDRSSLNKSCVLWTLANVSFHMKR